MHQQRRHEEVVDDEEQEKRAEVNPEAQHLVEPKAFGEQKQRHDVDAEP